MKNSLAKRKVVLSGLTDIMFDRYAGDNKTELPVERKMYFTQDGKNLMLPSANILSFLSAENTESAPKRILPPKEYKKVAKAFLSHITIEPFDIPITRNGKQIVFNGFVDGEDKKAGIYVYKSVARLKGGIPHPKIRPVVRLPWDLEFDVTIYPNEEFNEDMLYNCFELGGISIGLGTYRGLFGKFKVAKWE